MKYKNKDGIELNFTGNDSTSVLVKEVVSEAVKLCSEYNWSNEVSMRFALQRTKDFLINAAYRHITFNYSNIADYYAHSSKEMQELMEESALIIIDFEKAKTLDEKTDLLLKQCEDFSHGYELVTSGMEKIRKTFKVMADEMQKDRQDKVDDLKDNLIKSFVDAATKDEDK